LALVQLVFWLNGTYAQPSGSNAQDGTHLASIQGILAKKLPNLALLKFRESLTSIIQGLFVMQILATYIFNIEIVKYYYQRPGNNKAYDLEDNSLGDLQTWLRLMGVVFATRNALFHQYHHIFVMAAIIPLSSLYRSSSYCHVTSSPNAPAQEIQGNVGSSMPTRAGAFNQGQQRAYQQLPEDDQECSVDGVEHNSYRQALKGSRSPRKNNALITGFQLKQ